MKNAAKDNRSERGGAGVKFLAVVVVLLLLANAGYNYVPVAYQGQSFQEEMRVAVVQGLAIPKGMTPVENIKNRLTKAVTDYELPPDTFMEVKQVGSVVQAHVVYQKQVGLLPFGIYKYTYNFDHTATPAGFLLKD